MKDINFSTAINQTSDSLIKNTLIKIKYNQIYVPIDIWDL